MIRSKWISSLATAACLMSLPAHAQTQDIVEAMSKTPASAMDLFLSNFYIAAGGQPYLGSEVISEANRAVRIFKTEYNPNTGLIYASFHISPSYTFPISGTEATAGTIERLSTTAERRQLMLAAARALSQDLGVELQTDMGPSPMRFGLLQLAMQPLFPSGLTREQRIHMAAAVANRMELRIIYPNSKKRVYTVNRTAAGDYIYSEREKEV